MASIKLSILCVILIACAGASPTSQPSGTDLAPIINAATSGQAISGTASATFFTRSTATVATTSAGVTLDLGGGSLDVAASPKASSNIVVSGREFTLRNGSHILGANVLAFLNSTAANCTVQNCWIDAATTRGIDCEGAPGLAVSKCFFGHTGSQSIYVTGNASVIDHCYFAGAIGEYDLRWEPDSAGVIPDGATVSDCVFLNTAAYNKDTLGARMIHNLTLKDCIIQGDIRLGQATATEPGQWVTGSITGCTFFGTRPGITSIVCYQGVKLVASNNRFYLASDNSPAMAVDSNSVLTGSGNVIVHPVWPAGTHIPALVGISSKGDYNGVAPVIYDTSVAGNQLPSTRPAIP